MYDCNDYSLLFFSNSTYICLLSITHVYEQLPEDKTNNILHTNKVVCACSFSLLSSFMEFYYLRGLSAYSLKLCQVGVDKDPNDNLDTMTCLCSSLLYNCLHYIDTHADQVNISILIM